MVAITGEALDSRIRALKEKERVILEFYCSIIGLGSYCCATQFTEWAKKQEGSSGKLFGNRVPFYQFRKLEQLHFLES